MHSEPLSTPTTWPDNDLVARIVAGEKNLYSILVQRHNQRVYRTGLAILDDDNEVEDAMQAAYVNAYIQLEKFAYRSTFSTWLTRIMVNECFLRLKNRDRTVKMIHDYMEDHVLQKQTSTPATPYGAATNAELRTILDHAIRQLPEMYRTVFVLREIEQLNVAETQACLSISAANVKVRLNRARLLLRNLLSAYYQKEDLLHFHLSRCDRMIESVMYRITTLS